MRRRLGGLALTCSIVAGGCTLPDDGSEDEALTTETTEVVTAATTTTEVDARQIYIVRPGDTMVRIAARFDIDLNALVKENGIADPTRIYVGQQLFIPPPPDEQRGPILTLAPPTRPNLPPLTPTITFDDPNATSDTSSEDSQG